MGRYEVATLDVDDPVWALVPVETLVYELDATKCCVCLRGACMGIPMGLHGPLWPPVLFFTDDGTCATMVCVVTVTVLVLVCVCVCGACVGDGIGEPEVHLMRCQCLDAMYCSRECQAKDRPLHKPVCKLGRAEPFGTPRILSLPRSGLTAMHVGEHLAMSQV
jgi:hypothetical protein